RLKEAYQIANANMQFDFDTVEGDLTAAQVFLFSDGRVPESDIRDLSLRGRLHYERVGSMQAPNMAIVAASAKRNYERPTEVQVFARMANYGPEPAEGRVRISVANLPDDEEDAADALEFNPVTL